MQVYELLEKRRIQWQELEQLCGRLKSEPKKFRENAAQVARFAMLYRSACSDLAMAETHRWPPTTIEYLHRLVGQGHNQLYRSRSLDLNYAIELVAKKVPRAIFSDFCVHIAAIVFFGLFTISAILGRSEQQFPKYAEQIATTEALDGLEESFRKPLAGNAGQYTQMAGFYIQHNTSIGLTCYGKGPLIIPCIIELAYQAIYLGAMFGYMARPGIASGDHFFQFVTAHGPFELTAIALSAAAGLRLGMGLIATAGLMRMESFKAHAIRSLPIAAAAVTLFFLAAFTEGFISPSPLPYAYKALWAIISSTAMMFYFVILGYARDEE